MEVSLGALFVSTLILSIYSRERSVIPWQSGSIPIHTSLPVKSVQPVPHPKPSHIASAPYKTIIQIAKQITLQSCIGTRVSATPTVSGLFLLEPELLNKHHFHLLFVSGIIDKFRDLVLGILTANFGSTMQVQPKSMVLTQAVVKFTVIVD